MHCTHRKRDGMHERTGIRTVPFWMASRKMCCWAASSPQASDDIRTARYMTIQTQSIYNNQYKRYGWLNVQCTCLNPRHRRVLPAMRAGCSLASLEATCAAVYVSPIGRTLHSRQCWCRRTHRPCAGMYDIVQTHHVMHARSGLWPCLTCQAFFRDSVGWQPSGSPMIGRLAEPPVVVYRRCMCHSYTSEM